MTPKESNRRYNHSEKGIARAYRYRATEKGKENMKKYKLSHPYYYSAEYQRERYHRIQDEAGCHRGVGDFYPAYTLIKALETAGVVEIPVGQLKSGRPRGGKK